MTCGKNWLNTEIIATHHPFTCHLFTHKPSARKDMITKIFSDTGVQTGDFFFIKWLSAVKLLNLLFYIEIYVTYNDTFLYSGQRLKKYISHNSNPGGQSN